MGSLNNQEERFYKKIKIVETGCWEWTAARYNNKHMYGSFRYNSKKTLAHRASYLIYNGDIPEGLLVCHTCDNEKCVNPGHLFLGTQSDNMQDMLSKNRGRHKNHVSKECPTETNYRNGCRCELCKELHSTANKKFRDSKKDDKQGFLNLN